ncbi:hypothetical protein IWQ54_006576 [Labrenzia sp. EL_195]|nr:hypothetical protein [Labrenzia sp. EL_195]
MEGNLRSVLENTIITLQNIRKVTATYILILIEFTVMLQQSELHQFSLIYSIKNCLI